MSDLFDSTKLVAYYLWEETGCERALELWYCAEDIACYLARANILDRAMIVSIRELNPQDEGYLYFVRHLAFRLFIYTGNTNCWANWFFAENLISNESWIEHITGMATILHSDKGRMREVRSDTVRMLYGYQQTEE